MRRWVLAGFASAVFAVASASVMAQDAPVDFGAPATAGGNDPGFLVMGVGGYEFWRANSGRTAEVDLSIRGERRYWIFKPQFGVMATANGAAYGYAGPLIDLYWGKHIVTTFSTAVGYYHRGGGRDIGSHIEFRSGGELGYRFDDRSRLSLGVYHISNAGITDRNPGEESLLVQYSLPINKLFSH